MFQVERDGRRGWRRRHVRPGVTQTAPSLFDFYFAHSGLKLPLAMTTKAMIMTRYKTFDVRLPILVFLFLFEGPADALGVHQKRFSKYLPLYFFFVCVCERCLTSCASYENFPMNATGTTETRGRKILNTRRCPNGDDTFPRFWAPYYYIQK